MPHLRPRRLTATSPIPRNPVPYRHRPIELNNGWTTWQIEDQRFVDHRPDVSPGSPMRWRAISWFRARSPPISSRQPRPGQRLIVKVIDVIPEKYPADVKMGGYELMIAGDVLRGRYRTSLEKPAPIVPQCCDALYNRLSGQRPRLFERTSDHGAGAEHVVPG